MRQWSRAGAWATASCSRSQQISGAKTYAPNCPDVRRSGVKRETCCPPKRRSRGSSHEAEEPHTETQNHGGCAGGFLPLFSVALRLCVQIGICLVCGMTRDGAVVALAREAGLETAWTDARGAAQTVGVETLRAVLAALALPANTRADIED